MLHGKPFWFELYTARGGLSDAGAFYARVFDWEISDSGMEGMRYHLGRAGADMVAGLMEMPDEAADMPPAWMIYLAVEDADAAAARITELGGRIYCAPADIPGTGRFATAADPQGAAFGILAPGPSEPGDDSDSGAWNQSKAGHGNWIELMSSDPAAGFEFYAQLFGWSRGEAMDMGEMGTYQLFAWGGGDIGGMMGLCGAPQPYWLPYFGVDGVNAAITRVKDAGGAILRGPIEVPGPAFIAILRDPQGAHFAIVGPLEAS